MNVTKYLTWECDGTGVIPHTSLWTRSKQCNDEEVLMGKGRVLLLLILQLEQFKKTSLREILLSDSKPDLNKDTKVRKWGWPNRLCHNWLLLELEAENNADELKFRSCVESWNGNRQPHLGPFAVTFPDAWSCITQPEREKKQHNDYQLVGQQIINW